MFLHRILYAALLLFVLSCDGLLLAMVHSEHQRAWNEGVARIESSAAVLGNHAARAMEAGDGLLKRLCDQVEAWDGRDPAMGKRIWTKLKAHVESSPHVGSAWVVDAGGTQLLSNWEFPIDPMIFAHRRYYRAHLDGEIGLFLDPPQVGTTHNKLRFTLSRAVRGPDGQLKAVVVVGIFTDYFNKVFGETDLGDKAEMVLVSRAGDVLAAWPTSPATRALAVRTDAVRGTRTETLDGEERLVSGQAVNGFPAQLVIDVPVEQVMAGWRRQAIVALAFAVPANLGFVVLMMMGRRGLQREEAYRGRLEAQEPRIGAGCARAHRRTGYGPGAGAHRQSCQGSLSRHRQP